MDPRHPAACERAIRRAGNRCSARFFLAGLLLVLSVLAVYRPVGSHPFIRLDDGQYVSENPVVKRGITADGVLWSFTTFHAGNWHPLTWLSHMADVELFGMDAGSHHRVNVALHALNSLLLFFVLRGMTGALWRSGFAAALFALHPLHVESVAWVAERKDVLSTLFLLLAIRAYSGYVRRPGMARSLCVFSLAAAGLMSKPMLVTLPLILLLLDFWPLGRTTGGVSRLVVEKIPLAALSAASCAVTFLAQKKGKAVADWEIIPIGLRLSNALVSYVKYLGKTIWPSGLSVFYPHPESAGGIPAWEVAAAFAGLSLCTFVAVRQARRRPFLAAGWMWYLVTLVPVIGLVQVGQQAMADRYTYVPLVGVFIAAAWAIPEIVSPGKFRGPLLAAGAIGILLGLGLTTWRQVGYWRSDMELFTHALDVSPGNGLAHNNVGMERLSRNEIPEALFHFREAMKYMPQDVTVLLNAGVAEAARGNLDEASRLFRKVLVIQPGEPRASRNLEKVQMMRRNREP